MNFYLALSAASEPVKHVTCVGHSVKWVWLITIYNKATEIRIG